MAYGDYTTYANIINELQGTNSQIANSAILTSRINRLITAASRMIDRWCLAPDKFFVGVAETRFFDILPNLNGPTRWVRDIGIGEGGAYVEYGGPTLDVMGVSTGEIPRIAIDPLIGLPSEVVVDQTLDGTYTGVMTYLTDYDLYPINAQNDGHPYIEIRWLPATAKVTFPIGQRTLRIRGLWGYQPLTASVQTLSLTGVPTGGTFTLSYGGDTTAAINWDAKGEDVQEALTNLPSLANLTGNYQGTTQVTVSDGSLPSDTLTIFVDNINFTGVTLASNNLTGGTSPNASLSGVTYTGPTCPPPIEQACIFQVVKWLKEIEAAPMGMAGSPEMGYTKVGPSDAVLEILEDGNFVQHWYVV